MIFLHADQMKQALHHFYLNAEVIKGSIFTVRVDPSLSVENVEV